MTAPMAAASEGGMGNTGWQQEGEMACELLRLERSKHLRDIACEFFGQWKPGNSVVGDIDIFSYKVEVIVVVNFVVLRVVDLSKLVVVLVVVVVVVIISEVEAGATVVVVFVVVVA